MDQLLSLEVSGGLNLNHDDVGCSWEEDEDDILVCGRCKAQFNKLEHFFSHKKICRNSSDKRSIPPISQFEEVGVSSLKSGLNCLKILLTNSDVGLLHSPTDLDRLSPRVVKPLSVVSIVDDVKVDSLGGNLTVDGEENEKSGLAPPSRISFTTAHPAVSENRRLMNSMDDSAHFADLLAAHAEVDPPEVPFNRSWSAKCVRCSLEFQTPVLYERHMKTHTQASEYENCVAVDGGIIMTSTASLGSEGSKHSLRTLASSGGHHKCPICQRSFPSADSLAQHTREMSVDSTSHGVPFVGCGTVSVRNPLLCQDSSAPYVASKPTSLVTTNQSQQTSLLAQSAVGHRNPSESVSSIATLQPSAEQLNNLAEPPGKKKKSANKCFYCNKAFKKTSDMLQHVRSHTGEKPFQCLLCGRGFAQKSNVKKHMATHKVWPKKDTNHKLLITSSTVLESSKCSKSKEYQERGDDGKILEKSNSSQVIVIDNQYRCLYCDQTFTSFKLYKTHQSSHKGEKKYRCLTVGCGELFTTVPELIHHNNSNHKDTMEYRCHVCPERFTDLNDLNLHQYIHLTDRDTREKQQFECSHCRAKFKTTEGLDYHLQTDSHDYTCSICEKVFTVDRYLKKHMEQVHGDQKFKCDICQKQLSTIHKLRSHKMTHSGEMPYSCPECPSKFNRKDNLKRHMLNHKKGGKTYACPFHEHLNCDKVFGRLDMLKSHINTHRNVKPFKCDACDKTFSRKEHLKTHTNKIHPK